MDQLVITVKDHVFSRKLQHDELEQHLVSGFDGRFHPSPSAYARSIVLICFLQLQEVAAVVFRDKPLFHKCPNMFRPLVFNKALDMVVVAVAAEVAVVVDSPQRHTLHLNDRHTIHLQRVAAEAAAVEVGCLTKSSHDSFKQSLTLKLAVEAEAVVVVAAAVALEEEARVDVVVAAAAVRAAAVVVVVEAGVECLTRMLHASWHRSN